MRPLYLRNLQRITSPKTTALNEALAYIEMLEGLKVFAELAAVEVGIGPKLSQLARDRLHVINSFN